MNAYIQLNGKRYMTTAKSWTPIVQKPSTTRLNLDGELDATYGKGGLKEWEGEIKVRLTPEDANYGTKDELLTALNTLGGITFRDHLYPATPEYTVHVQNYKQRSSSPKWDGPNNSLFFTVRLVTKNA